jgi:hypothetical protein
MVDMEAALKSFDGSLRNKRAAELSSNELMLLAVIQRDKESKAAEVAAKKARKLEKKAKRSPEPAPDFNQDTHAYGMCFALRKRVVFEIAERRNVRKGSQILLGFFNDPDTGKQHKCSVFRKAAAVPAVEAPEAQQAAPPAVAQE